jgi:hypothetical protein
MKSTRHQRKALPETVSPVIWLTGLGAVAAILLLLFSVVMG